MSDNWKDYLSTAEQALKKLDQNQTATVAKLIALQLGAYRLKYGDAELEDFEEHIGVKNLSEKGQHVFIKGMESLLSVVKEIDMSREVEH